MSIYNKVEVVREFAQMGYKVPLDVAVSLMGDGYDISDLEKDLDGYDIQDLIYEKELYDN
jgi:hypothetical protein